MKRMKPTGLCWSLCGILLMAGVLGLGMTQGTTVWAQDEAAVVEETTEEAAAPAAEETPAEANVAEAAAEETSPSPPTERDDWGYTINTLLMFLCAVLVLFMQAGFAMLEVGLNAAKNTVNILFKNVMDLSIGGLLFFFVGFGLMYPGSFEGANTDNGWFAFGGPGIYTTDATPGFGWDEETNMKGFSPNADFLFQVAFAATAATIVSGAVAGRMKFEAYLIYSAIITAIVYPISGYWKWGGGWTTRWEGGLEFQDFAGSAVVHGVGGFAALAGAIALGPRLGRFVKGKSVALPGHNLVFTTLGVLILFIGWFGFNPGSMLEYAGYEAIDATAMIAVTTFLAAMAGTATAMAMAWVMFKKPDLTMALNGTLGGLVGITANADCMGYGMSIVVGAVAGVVVVLAILLLDKLKIDDPCGAFPVHGACGIWGCLAIGILPNAHLEAGSTNLMVQTVSTVAICAWAFFTMLAVFMGMKMLGILRVTPEEEQAGLDISEHGMHAYPAHLTVDGFTPTASSTPKETVGA